MNTIQNFDRPNTRNYYSNTGQMIDAEQILNFRSVKPTKRKAKKLFKNLNFSPRSLQIFYSLANKEAYHPIQTSKTRANTRLTLFTSARVPATMNMLVKQVATSNHASRDTTIDISRLSEPVRHLSSHPLHSFSWKPLFLSTLGPYAESLKLS